jgi:hypothetical protein
LDLDALQYVNFQARNAGQTWSVTLQFRDTDAPFTLFANNHFPYGMNLAAATDASFNYHDSGGGELTTFRADLTSVSLTLPPPPPPPQPTCTTLIEQVNSSNLPERRKQPLLATLKAACAADDRGNCEAARGQLSAFQKKLHAQISTDDPGLANALSAAAQAIIDRVCQ